MRSRQVVRALCTTVILAATILCSAPAHAQGVVKGGFSASTISFSPENNAPELNQVERSNGFVGGLSFLLPTNKAGGYQIEVLFHQKGARNLLRRNDHLSLAYLEIPVLLHLDVFQRDPRAIFLIGGAAPAFNAYASYEDEGVEQDVASDIENFDIGLVLGGGVELRYLTVEARYTWGLRSAFHDGELEGAFKNRTFSVLVGLRFGR